MRNRKTRTTSSTSPRNPAAYWLLLNEQLGRLAAIYPEAGHNDDTLRIVAEDWVALLAREEATEREFLAALERVKDRCDHFPKRFHLLEALDWVREHPDLVPESRRLTDDPPPERRRRNLEGIRTLTAQLAGRITREESNRRLAALGIPLWNGTLEEAQADLDAHAEKKGWCRCDP